MAGCAQGIWSTCRIGAKVSKFVDTKRELLARSSTVRQSCEILVVTQTRKSPDYIQRQVEVQYLFKESHHENHKRHMWISWQDSYKASDQPSGLMQDFRYLQIRGVSWSRGQALDDRVLESRRWCWLANRLIAYNAKSKLVICTKGHTMKYTNGIYDFHGKIHAKHLINLSVWCRTFDICR